MEELKLLFLRDARYDDVLIFLIVFFLSLFLLYFILSKNTSKKSIDPGNTNVVNFKKFRQIKPYKTALKDKIARKNNFQAKNILNGSEQKFFGNLCDALTDCHVFPQVSFNALITHATWISRPYWQRMVRSKFNAKYVDFVVCTKLDLKVIAVIEYDGPGHQSNRDAERDRLLTGAGYRVERFTNYDTPQSIRVRFGLQNRGETKNIEGDLPGRAGNQEGPSK